VLLQLRRRIVVAIIGGPIVLLCAYFGSWPFVVLISFILLFSLKEFYDLCERKGSAPNRILGYLFALFILWDFYASNGNNLTIILPVFIIIVSIAELWRNKESAIYNLSTTLWGVGYLAILLSFFVAIRQLPLVVGLSYSDGGYLVLLFILVFWFGDTMAYFVGSTIGKHKLAIRISPNKTIEGAVAGFLSMILLSIVAQALFLQFLSLIDALVIGVICGTVGQMSDLVESLFKRDAGVKDTSKILAGHGGVFDRFDVLFLISPLIYFYLRYFAFG